MFALNFLRRCYGKRMYLFLVLILLDVLTIFYSGGIDHPLTRHMFISYDLVSGFANILFWIILFLPIALDIVQERSSFGIAIFCRTPKSKYLMMKNTAMFIYCASFFIISMIISFAIGILGGYETGNVILIIKLYIVLVLLSYTLLSFINLVGWIFNSSYVVTVIYSGLITITQIPDLQENFSVMTLVEKFPLSISALVICSAINSLITLPVMKHKDFIGIKKGMTI